MTLQAQAMQRGEKFKESEARPKVEVQLEKMMTLDWLEGFATVNVVDPKEQTPEELLGISPEELAASMQDDAAKKAEAEKGAEEGAEKGSAPGPPADDGYEWGGTY